MLTDESCVYCQRSNGGMSPDHQQVGNPSGVHFCKWYTILSYICLYMGVSWHGGTPNWTVYYGNPINNGWFGGTPISGKPIYPTYGVYYIYYHSEKPVDSPNIVYIYSFLCLRIVLGISAGHPFTPSWAHLIHLQFWSLDPPEIKAPKLSIWEWPWFSPEYVRNKQNHKYSAYRCL